MIGGLSTLSFMSLGVIDLYADETPKPTGNVIARGEDGVPWELYENGYLLFKPVAGKDTLTKNLKKNQKRNLRKNYLKKRLLN